MSKKQQKSPRSIPRTQQDVDRAFERGYADGIEDGVASASVILMTVLADKFGGGPYLPDVWRAVEKLSEEIREGRVSLADLRAVLLEEYSIRI